MGRPTDGQGERNWPKGHMAPMWRRLNETIHVTKNRQRQRRDAEGSCNGGPSESENRNPSREGERDTGRRGRGHVGAALLLLLSPTDGSQTLLGASSRWSGREGGRCTN